MAGPTSTRLPGRKRVEESFAREDDFGIVLILILLTIISFAASSGAAAQLLSVALSGGTLLFVLHTAGAHKRVFRISAVIVVIAVASTAIALMIDDDFGRSRAVAGLVGLLLAIVAPIVILRRIISASRITVRLILGALCIYLLLGLAYAYLFGFIDAITGTPFFVQTSTPETIDFVYFSYTTLATVGYGDFTAASSLGRMVAISEGLVGQLFLVSAVALLVGNVGRSLRPGATGPNPPADDLPATDADAAPAAEDLTPPGR